MGLVRVGTIAALVAAGLLPVAVPTAAAGQCADVLFLGARGSGQPGPGAHGGWSPTAVDPNGLGGTVRASLSRFRQALSARRSIAVVSLDYPAERVSTRAWHTPGHSYWAGLELGVSGAAAQLRRAAVSCPDQRFVLSGYSQGAMVLHRLVRRLDAHDPDLLARVDAVLLIGDGDRVSHDRTRKFGSMHSSGHGVGLSPLVIGASESGTGKFSPRAGRLVLEVCNRNDSVCDYPGRATSPHLSYPGSFALRKASARAARMVLAVPKPTAD